MKRLALFLFAVLVCAGQDLNSVSRTASGNITGTNASCLGFNCVWIVPPTNANAVTVQISGTFTATVQFEASTTGLVYSSIAATNGDTSATATGSWSFPLYGYRAFRVRGSAYTSGTAVVSIGAAAATTAGTGGWTDDGSTITAAAGRDVSISGDVTIGTTVLGSANSPNGIQAAQRNVTLGATLYPDTTSPILSPNVTESSVIVLASGTCYMFYRASGGGSSLFLRTATDPDCHSWGSASTVLTDIVYTYIWYYGSTFYLIGEKASANNNLYMWSSSNGSTWSAMNSGNPVLTGQSGDPTSYLYAISNPAVAQNGTTLYLLLEGLRDGDTKPSLLYSTTTTSALNFNTSITAAPVIAEAGNPDLKYVPAHGSAAAALMVIYGDVSPADGVYIVSAKTALLSADLTQSASWVAAPNWQTISLASVEQADPYMAFTPSGSGKNWGGIVQWGCTQTTICQSYTTMTLEQFYDTISQTAAGQSGSTAGNFYGLYYGRWAGSYLPVGTLTRGLRIYSESQGGTTHASQLRLQLTDDSAANTWVDVLKITGNNKNPTFYGGTLGLNGSTRGLNIIAESQGGTTTASRLRLQLADDSGVAGTYNDIQTCIGSNKTCTFAGPVVATGNLTAGNGSNTVYRCATAGTLPVGALTIDATQCGTTADTGLRVK